MLHRKTLLLVIVFALVFVPAISGCPGGDEQGQDQPPPENGDNGDGQEQPQFAFVSSEEYPGGCADCHQGEYALENELPEGHPRVEEGTTVENCKQCHSDNLNSISHEAHLTGGEESTYISNYNGVCNHCHKLTEEGDMVVKGLEAEGTRFVSYEEANIEDPKDGCTDCHQGDYALENEIPEGHPAVEEGATLETCLTCHSNNIDKISHQAHYQGGEENNFRNYGNSCQNCHRQQDGQITTKGAAQ